MTVEPTLTKARHFSLRLSPRTVTPQNHGSFVRCWQRRTHLQTHIAELLVHNHSSFFHNLFLKLCFSFLNEYLGTTQGIAIIENLIEHIAKIRKEDPLEFRLKNLNSSDSNEVSSMRKIIDEVRRTSDFDKRVQEVTDNSIWLIFYFNFDRLINEPYLR